MAKRQCQPALVPALVVIKHILLSYEAEAENISTDDVIDHILTKVPVP